jgi:type IV pilus assembly protein PilB
VLTFFLTVEERHVAQPKKRLGEILVAASVIDELQLKSALSEQRKWGGRLGRTLVEMGFVEEPVLVRALSKQLGLPAVDLDQVQVTQDLTQALRVDLAEHYSVFPVSVEKRHKILQLATAEPTNYEAEKELTFHTGMRIQLVLAGPRAIEKAIRRHYHGEEIRPVASPGVHVSPDFRAHEQNFDPSELSSRTRAAQMLKGESASRLAALEKQMASQIRALRTVLDLLEEKGHLAAGEYLQRLKGKR